VVKMRKSAYPLPYNIIQLLAAKILQTRRSQHQLPTNVFKPLYRTIGINKPRGWRGPL
jgi:hypothetical protein